MSNFADGPVTVRPAVVADVPAIASIFGRAFDEYRHGLGISEEALASLWEPSLGARVASTLVAELPGGEIGGFLVLVLPGQKEEYGGREAGGRRSRIMMDVLGWRGLWRLPALFLPMGLAYAIRGARTGEMYISLLAVDPALQRKGLGQQLLAAADVVARQAGAVAILLHTASTNTRARTAYTRAGYELVSTVWAPWRGPANIPAFVALRKPLAATVPHA